MTLTSSDKSKLVIIALLGGNVLASELPVSLFLDGRMPDLVNHGYIINHKITNLDKTSDFNEYRLTKKGWEEVLHFVDPKQISALHTHLSKIRMGIAKQ